MIVTRVCTLNGRIDAENSAHNLRMARITTDQTITPNLAELVQTCPIDGMRLRSRHCKLICSLRVLPRVFGLLLNTSKMGIGRNRRAIGERSRTEDNTTKVHEENKS